MDTLTWVDCAVSSSKPHISVNTEVCDPNFIFLEKKVFSLLLTNLVYRAPPLSYTNGWTDTCFCFTLKSISQSTVGLLSMSRRTLFLAISFWFIRLQQSFSHFFFPKIASLKRHIINGLDVVYRRSYCHTPNVPQHYGDQIAYSFINFPFGFVS